MLKKTFHAACKRSSLAPEATIQLLWLEIENNYSEEGRHYHTLEHLEHVITELKPVKKKIKDWDVLLFSIFYHDIIYYTLKRDNEEKSAAVAAQRLKKLGLSKERAEACQKQILATHKHVKNPDHDTNYFIDADLAILGKDEESYAQYVADIRKEYHMYPDVMYNNGRRAFMERFLAMDRIYNTPEFFAKYEEAARKNIENELKGKFELPKMAD